MHLQGKTKEGLSNSGVSTNVVLKYRAICDKMCEQIGSKKAQQRKVRVTTQSLMISNSWF